MRGIHWNTLGCYWSLIYDRAHVLCDSSCVLITRETCFFLNLNKVHLQLSGVKCISCMYWHTDIFFSLIKLKWPLLWMARFQPLVCTRGAGTIWRAFYIPTLRTPSSCQNVFFLNLSASYTNTSQISAFDSLNQQLGRPPLFYPPEALTDVY